MREKYPYSVLMWKNTDQKHSKHGQFLRSVKVFQNLEKYTLIMRVYFQVSRYYLKIYLTWLKY